MSRELNSMLNKRKTWTLLDTRLLILLFALTLLVNVWIHLHVYWWSCILDHAKQFLVATSTVEVEFISYFEATSKSFWLKSFKSRLRAIDTIPKLLKLYSDNSAVVFSLDNEWKPK